MKFDVYERFRDLLHGRDKVGGVREGFAQVLDRCFSLRVHVFSSVARTGQHALLDDLVCSQERRLRNRQPQRLRGLEVDDQLKLGG